MSKLLINPSNVSVDEVKTKIRVSKSNTVKAAKQPSSIRKKQINIPIPDSLTHTGLSLLQVTDDGDIIHEVVKQEKTTPEIMFIKEEVPKLVTPPPAFKLPTHLVGEEPFYTRPAFQIAGGIAIAVTTGYLIYKYWPSGATEAIATTGKAVVKDSVKSTL